MKINAVGKWLKRSLSVGAAALALQFITPVLPAAAGPLKIGYSDWPGFVAWQVGIEKGWFKEAGVDVQFEWFDYSASLDAFAAGKLDAVGVTNGDVLVVGANGAKSVIAIINDYSNGNDMVIAKPGLRTLKDLKGKKIGVELGLVDHLLLLNALEKAGMQESDVDLVNAPTNELPQVLASGDVDAVAVWQPNSNIALQLVPGSKSIYNSSDAPGLIYDALTVSPASLSSHRADWQKVAKVWYRIVNYIYDPATHADAVKIMSSRVGLKPAEYEPLLGGTKILTLPEAKQAFVKADGLKSIYGSSKIVDQFNLKYGVYKQAQPIDSYFDPALTNGL